MSFAAFFGLIALALWKGKRFGDADNVPGWESQFGNAADKAPDSPVKVVLRDKSNGYLALAIGMSVFCVVLFGWAHWSHPDRIQYADFLPFSLFVLPFAAVFGAAHFLQLKTRFEFDGQYLHMHTATGSRPIDLRTIRQIVVIQEQGGDLITHVIDQQRNVIASVYERTARVRGVPGEIMRRSRSPDVELISRNLKGRWLKRTNLKGSHWQPCEQPDWCQSVNWKSVRQILIASSLAIVLGYLVSFLLAG